MPPGSTALLRLALCSALAAAAGPGHAQLRAGPSAWGPGPDSVKLHTDPLVDLHTTAPTPIDPYKYKRGLFSAMGLYEYKPVGAVEGQYTRPHYALGLHSDLMRDALSLTGLEAENCVAPMLRMRARQTTVTGANGISMTVFARCTFR